MKSLAFDLFNAKNDYNKKMIDALLKRVLAGDFIATNKEKDLYQELKKLQLHDLAKRLHEGIYS